MRQPSRSHAPPKQQMVIEYVRAYGQVQALGKCLDATGVSSADRTSLQIWECSGGANQKWTLP